MQPTTSPNTLHQGCLGHLQHILELALHTADAASAEGNHKITLQAIREVTRIITLMTKMAPAAEPEAGSKPKPAQIPANTQTGATQNSELERCRLTWMHSRRCSPAWRNCQPPKPILAMANRLFTKWEKSGK